MSPLFDRAQPKDVIKIGRLLREFYAKQGEVYGIPYSHEHTLNFIAGIIANGICLVGPSSCAGSILVPFPYNNRAVIAYVPFWYFRSAREVRILEALMDACRKAGATHINPSSHFPDNRIGRRYAELGLRPVEAYHLGELNNPCKGLASE